MLLLLVHEEIVSQTGDRHQTLDEEVLQRHEHAEGCHTGDEGVEIAADLVLHEHDLLPEEALALRGFRPPLALGGEGGDLGEPLVDGLEVLGGDRAALHEQPRELPVHDQVRIATDRRGEVAVVRRRERVVAAALRGVERLALRAEQQVAQEPLLGPAGDRVQDLLERRGRDLGQIALELVAEALEDFPQIDQAVRIGTVVDAIDRRLLGEEQMLRDGLVGRQHELLDELVGDVARLRDDADDQPLVVQHDVRVRQVEVDRSAGLAAGAQQRRDLGHEAEVVEVRAVLLPVVGVRRRPSRRGARPRCRSSDGRSGSRRWVNSECTTRPDLSRSRIADRTRRSTRGLSEQSPFESRSGSIGRTRPGK